MTPLTKAQLNQRIADRRKFENLTGIVWVGSMLTAFIVILLSI